MGGSLSMSDLPRKKATGQTIDQIIDRQEGRTIYKPLHEVMPSGIWKGRRCFIVGGGTSLKGFDFSQLKGELVIAVNRAMEYIPNAAIMFSQDARLWGWYEDGSLGEEARSKFQSFKGFRTWLNTPNFPFPEDIYTIPCTNKRDFGWTSLNYSAGLPFCSSSGLSALCLAICLGANPIYLLGFDLYGINGKTANFHNGYPEVNQDTLYKESMLPNFDQFAEAINKATKVINLNSKSELKFFEFGKFEDIKKIERPIFIGFYTKNTWYQKEIKNLEESLIRFGLEYHIEGLENLKDWRKNCHQKMNFILRCMEKYPNRNIVQMDSDVRILAYPELFERLEEYDIGVYMIPSEDYIHLGKKHTVKDITNVSVLYLKNCLKVQNLVKHWEKQDATFEDHIDDLSFRKVLTRSKGIKVFNLPQTYCHIYDRKIEEEPVIQLFQASRRYRNKVNSGIEVENEIVMVSFYTRNTPYELEIKTLINSLRKFNLPYDTMGIENQGSFEANTKQKPIILKTMLDRYPNKSIVFVDADAVVEKIPELFYEIKEDIAMHWIDWNKKNFLRKGMQLCTGTIYLRNNVKVRELLDLWIQKNKTTTGGLTDQEGLEEVLEEHKDIVSIYSLPEEYAHIPEYMQDTKDSVIRHRQVSRQYRNSIVPVITSDEFKTIEKNKYEYLWSNNYIPSQCAKPLALHIAGRANPSWKLIDLGCGDGTTVKELINKGFNCRGMDITSAGIKHTKKIWFVEGCIWEMPFSKNEFDYTFSTDMLEHIPIEKIDDTIKEIIRVTSRKTFHCIANFDDIREIKGQKVNLHRIKQPIDWWKNKFEELNTKLIEIELMDRAEFIGRYKMQMIGVFE